MPDQNDLTHPPLALPAPEPAHAEQKQQVTDQPPARPGATGHARLLWFLAIPLLLVLFGLYRWRKDVHASKALAGSNAAAQAEPVVVQQPAQGQPTRDLVLPATLQGLSDSPIYARVNGYVSQWFTDIGRRVGSGDLLARIDSPEIDQQVIQAQAALGTAQANLALAKVTTARYQDLIKSNSVAQQEVDQNVQNLSTQQQAVISSSANLANLQKQQSYERVTAPFPGVITARKTDIGDLIAAGNGGSELFHLTRLDTMRIFVSVPEDFSQQIGPGQHASVQLTELPGQTFDGKVARTNHSIDLSTRTLVVEVDVANPGGKLLPGAYGSVHFNLAEAHRPLIVPTGAVLFQAAGPQVAIVTPDNRVQLHKVGIGRDLGNTIEITSGLNPLDRLIPNPPDYLVDGMPVSVQGSQPAAAAAPAAGKS